MPEPLVSSADLLVRAEELHREALAEVARLSRRLDALEQAHLSGGADRQIGSREIAARLGISYQTFLGWAKEPAMRARLARFADKRRGRWYSTPRRITDYLSVERQAARPLGSRRPVSSTGTSRPHPAPARKVGAGPA